MSKYRYNFNDVVNIVRRLRGENGCPWDNEQTYQTLRKYLLEEVYEALDAIDREDFDNLAEELGDSLWEILFLARIAEQDGSFVIDDVIDQLGHKMVRRHPHIFGDETVDDSEGVIKRWAQIKKEEGKTGKTSEVLKKVPQALPALLRAQRIGERVSKVGFDWETTDQVMEKLDEEIAEFKEAVQSGSKKDAEEEMGDLIFTLVNLARHMDVSAEDALRRTTEKFIRRFAEVERMAIAQGQELPEMGIEELETLWQNSKKKVG